ncbi:MAG: RNA polymerase sigma factor [Bacteroidota bacterium]
MKKTGKIVSITREELFTKWFEQAYNAHFEKLYLYAYSITKEKQLAEDVVSEVFLNIWNKKPKYDDIDEVGSYLFVSVKHLAIRLSSKDPAKFSYSTYDEALKISDSVDPEKLLINNELKRIVGEILAKLNPEYAIIYELVKNRGLSHDEIAQELGISPKTVSNKMNLILNKIRGGLNNYFNKSENNYANLMKISRVISLLITVTAFI